MKGTVLYGPGDIRFEDRETPKIVEPTDALIRISLTCVCGSESVAVSGASTDQRADANGARILRSRRGSRQRGAFDQAGAVRHRVVRHFRQYVSQLSVRLSVVVHAPRVHHAAQAPLLRVPLADGTLVPTPGFPSDDLLPSLLATSDVLGTGWFAADAANVKPGAIVAVVGDGAVGLLGVLSAKQIGAQRIIVMSRHEKRQKLAASSGNRHRGRAR